MDILIRFGFTIEEIKMMMDTNEEIEKASDHDIYEIIEILNQIGCTDHHMKNIFLCNPFCLTSSSKEMKQFILKLEEIGCHNIFSILDHNPYLLNMTEKDLEKLFHKYSHEGYSKEEFIHELKENILF